MQFVEKQHNLTLKALILCLHPRIFVPVKTDSLILEYIFFKVVYYLPLEKGVSGHLFEQASLYYTQYMCDI